MCVCVCVCVCVFVTVILSNWSFWKLTKMLVNMQNAKIIMVILQNYHEFGHLAERPLKFW